MGLKEQIQENPEKFKLFFGIYNRLFGKNKIRIKGQSKLLMQSALLKKTNIYIEGDQNVVEIRNLTKMNGSSIFIKGNKNKIIIDERNGLEECGLWLEDDGNEIQIGVHNRFFKNTHLAALEGTKIIIGEDGLFAPGVEMRTSDSHSILDMDGKRLNPAKDIHVGNHVWIGAGSAVLKGSRIPDECIVGMHSMVNKELDEANSLYVGSPVKKVKTGVTWDSKRR